jgi:hypothetical protein
MENRKLSAAELSRVLGISEWTIRKLVNNKDIPFEYEKGVIVFNLETLFEYFRNMEAAA